MDPKSRHAVRIIRQTIRAGRYRLLSHFALRMDQRGLFWPDVSAILDRPSHVCSEGLDKYGRAKWILSGVVADGLEVSIVCAIDVDENGELTVFITIF